MEVGTACAQTPCLSSLCLRTMPSLGMSSASPTTAGQLCGHCRHVCPPAPGRGHNMSPAEPACRQLLPSGSCLCVCLGGWSMGPASTLPGCGMQVFLVVRTDDFVLKCVGEKIFLPFSYNLPSLQKPHCKKNLSPEGPSSFTRRTGLDLRKLTLHLIC